MAWGNSTIFSSAFCPVLGEHAIALPEPLLIVFHSFYLVPHFRRANSENLPKLGKRDRGFPQLQRPPEQREYLLPLWISLSKNTILCTS